MPLTRTDRIKIAHAYFRNHSHNQGVLVKRKPNIKTNDYASTIVSSHVLSSITCPDLPASLESFPSFARVSSSRHREEHPGTYRQPCRSVCPSDALSTSNVSLPTFPQPCRSMCSSSHLHRKLPLLIFLQPCSIYFSLALSRPHTFALSHHSRISYTEDRMLRSG